jgi:hypothetical protein
MAESRGWIKPCGPWAALGLKSVSTPARPHTRPPFCQKKRARSAANHDCNCHLAAAGPIDRVLLPSRSPSRLLSFTFPSASSLPHCCCSLAVAPAPAPALSSPPHCAAQLRLLYRLTETLQLSRFGHTSPPSSHLHPALPRIFSHRYAHPSAPELHRPYRPAYLLPACSRPTYPSNPPSIGPLLPGRPTSPQISHPSKLAVQLTASHAEDGLSSSNQESEGARPIMLMDANVIANKLAVCCHG